MTESQSILVTLSLALTLLLTDAQGFELSSIPFMLYQQSLQGRKAPHVHFLLGLRKQLLCFSLQLPAFLTAIGAGSSQSLGVAFQYLLAC